jgi:hypothetical protein
MRSGNGDHRRSTFRELVGAALIARNDHDCRTWDKPRSDVTEADREIEKPIEQEVSKLIGSMQFLWLAVDDEPGPNSQRGFIEQNSIALLSNLNKRNALKIDAPSEKWAR